MYLTHIRTRIWSPLIHIYSKKGFFGSQNIVVPLEYRGKNFFSNFECYDLTNGKE
jgi:hypothetical protein